MDSPIASRRPPQGESVATRVIRVAAPLVRAGVKPLDRGRRAAHLALRRHLAPLISPMTQPRDRDTGKIEQAV